MKEFEDLIRQGQMLEYADTELLWDSFNNVNEETLVKRNRCIPLEIEVQGR